MAGGQMMDLAAETADFDLPTVTRLQQLKTGALIGFSVEAGAILARIPAEGRGPLRAYARDIGRSAEQTSELQSLIRISYAVFCLNKKRYRQTQHNQPVSHEITRSSH